MTRFESSARTIDAGRKLVFDFLSDIRNFNTLVPEGKVRDFNSGKDYARFHVDGLGEVGVHIVSSEPWDTVVYGSEGSVPFGFRLLAKLKENEGGSSVLKLILEAELNVMMKMMAKKPLEEGIEMIASRLSDHLNQRQWT